MKRLMFLLLCGLVFSPGAFPARGAESKTKRVGVMKFDVSEEVKASLGKFLSETFAGQLVGSKQYIVVDWEEIDRVLGVVAKSQPNISAEDARKMAIDRLGLEKLFMGNVVKLGSKYHITVKLLALDLKVERMERGVAESDEKLPETVDQIGAAFLVDNSDEARAKRAAEKAAGGAETKRKEDERAAEEKRKQEVERRAQEQARFQAEAVGRAKAEARLSEEKRKAEAAAQAQAAARAREEEAQLKANKVKLAFENAKGTYVWTAKPEWHVHFDYELTVSGDSLSVTKRDRHTETVMPTETVMFRDINKICYVRSQYYLIFSVQGGRESPAICADFTYSSRLRALADSLKAAGISVRYQRYDEAGVIHDIQD